MSPVGREELAAAYARDQLARQRTACGALGVVLAVFWVLGYALFACGCARTPVLTPQDQVDLADHAVLVAQCKEVGRGVGKDGGVEAYYACVERGGR